MILLSVAFNVSHQMPLAFSEVSMRDMIFPRWHYLTAFVNISSLPTCSHLAIYCDESISSLVLSSGDKKYCKTKMSSNKYMNLKAFNSNLFFSLSLKTPNHFIQSTRKACDWDFEIAVDKCVDRKVIALSHITSGENSVSNSIKLLWSISADTHEVPLSSARMPRLLRTENEITWLRFFI